MIDMQRATVTQVAPLRVRLDGATADSPADAFATFLATVGRRVRVATVGSTLLVLDQNNAELLAGVGAGDYLPGWHGGLGEYELDLGRSTNGSNEWRRVCTVAFGAEGLDNTVANYTGATLEVELTDHGTSWGLGVPTRTLRQYVRMTNSNPFTTGNAVTAAIEGEWSGFDYLRVVRLDNQRTFELHVRAAAYYQLLTLRIRVGSLSGGTITWEKNGNPPLTASQLDSYYAGGGLFYFTSGSNPAHDSRGWIAGAYENGWASYDASGYFPAQYRRHRGVVYVRGLVSGNAAAANTRIFQLPAGFRPAPMPGGSTTNNQHEGGMYTNTGPGDGGVVLRADGSVQHDAGSKGWVDLSNLRPFLAEA